jgi:17beta-estradiol 17-dehydrogenase / 3alpha(17beta)-hydroxysteroid dehydrogenase (NAD+) / 3-oxoacyl-[acyl-carrier protein] reductase alpha subunit
MLAYKLTEGAIVNVSSASVKLGASGYSNYIASKAGVQGFTRTVAREMASYNIRCNAVMPGIIDTPLISTVPDEGFPL